jgi:hypothetical protein
VHLLIPANLLCQRLPAAAAAAAAKHLLRQLRLLLAADACQTRICCKEKTSTSRFVGRFVGILTSNRLGGKLTDKNLTVHSLNLDSYSLNLDPHSLNLDPHSQVPRFTCFASTKVQTLMPEELLDPQLDLHLA